MLLLPLVALSLFVSNVLSIPPPQAAGPADGSVADNSGIGANEVPSSSSSIVPSTGSSDANGDGRGVVGGSTDVGEDSDGPDNDSAVIPPSQADGSGDDSGGPDPDADGSDNGDDVVDADVDDGGEGSGDNGVDADVDDSGDSGDNGVDADVDDSGDSGDNGVDADVDDGGEDSGDNDVDADVDDTDADGDDSDVIDADLTDTDVPPDADVSDNDVADDDASFRGKGKPGRGKGRPGRGRGKGRGRGRRGRGRQLRIVNRSIAPDGFRRSSVLANGKFPGPLIRATKGRRVAIRVTNQLKDTTMDTETSIHWHGIFQTRTNWADGVPWVTQCPIKPQKSFVYQFDLGRQSGTHWYHSHYGVQYCDGLRGPLVIYDPRDPHKKLYDVDNARTVITLSDWYHTVGPKLGEIFDPVPANSTLINGLGRYPGGPASPLAVINVKRGLRYRFRVISMSCDPWFNFTIDGHRMTIIEVDGSEVQPVQVDSLPVFAGQRYSVVVTANQAVGNYWIRSATDQNGNFTGGINSAILRYVGAAKTEPTSRPGPYQLAFDEGNLHPLDNPRAPGTPGIGKADVNIQLAPSLNRTTRFFEVNNVSWNDPSVPVLLQILNGVPAKQLLPSGSIYELPPNQVIELNFPNNLFLPGKPHPIHLHGHEFSVVRHSGSSATNFVNPVRRDVVSMGNDPTDNVTIRFVTDNPGPWIIHCHIDWHLHHGFAVVMAESTAQASKLPVPAAWRQLCN